MKSKLFLVEAGEFTDDTDLDYVKNLLEHHGYVVKEFPCGGGDETWTDVYSHGEEYL